MANRVSRRRISLLDLARGCLVTDWVPNNKKYARVARLLRPHRSGGSIFLADYWISDAMQKKTNGGNSVPTVARTGQLRLVRQGSILRFLVADGSDNFRELERTEFGDDNVLVHFVVNNNGSPTNVDALLVDFEVRADELLPIAAAPAASTAASADEDEGGDVDGDWLAIIVLPALVILGGAWLFVRRWRRGRSAAARTV